MKKRKYCKLWLGTCMRHALYKDIEHNILFYIVESTQYAAHNGIYSIMTKELRRVDKI